jgi:hypothetical protein
MQQLTTPYTINRQPETAGGFDVRVNSPELENSPELVNSPEPVKSVAAYWYWFSHGVPLADR